MTTCIVDSSSVGDTGAVSTTVPRSVSAETVRSILAPVHRSAARVLTALATALVAVLATVGSAGPAAAAPGPATGLLQVGGLQRTYSVHVPPGAVTGLVINLHGAGQTGRDQEVGTNYDAVADRYRFVVAYPDGVDMSWADGRGGSVPERQGVDDVGFCPR